jgi:hypothetical protein
VRPLTGLVRYLGSDLLRSQRFLLPVLLYVLLLAPLFGGDPGPPPQLWTVTAVVLYPVSCWLAVTVANTEDPVQRQVTVAAGPRGSRSVCWSPACSPTSDLSPSPSAGPW